MKRALIVEDQAEIRDLIRMTLEFEDLEIHEVADGPAALEAARRLQPSLVLLDVMMPGGMDGYTVCEKLRADAAYKNTRIVMLTARARAEDRARGRQAGADAYLTKPFSPRELLDLVARLH